MRPHRYLASLSVVLTVVPMLLTIPARAQIPFADQSFERVWSRTDQPVQEGAVVRTWFWGPEPNGDAIYERYVDSPDNERLVQYFDKGRMEIIDPEADPSASWYVTSGLLTRELVSGRLQIGDDTLLDTGMGANVPVAGDPDNTFPTYADLGRIVDQSGQDQTGGFASRVLLPDGETTRPEAQADPNTGFVQFVSYTGPLGTPVGYNIPRAFWSFMTQPGLIAQGTGTSIADPLFDWLFVLGYPIAEPFWTQVRVAGEMRWVLVQPFERRVLTYTPANPDGWQVEMGNIGQHYERWRYAFTPPVPLSEGEDVFALAEGSHWTYKTTIGHDEIWEIQGTSRSFSGGSTLIARLERKWEGRRITYWSIRPDGLYLYGREHLAATGKIVESVHYWPPIKYLPDGEFAVDQEMRTRTTVISLNAPPRQIVASIKILAHQQVSTPAGVFPAWRIQFTEQQADTEDTVILNLSTFWFTPSIGVVQSLSDGFASQLRDASTLSQSE